MRNWIKAKTAELRHRLIRWLVSDDLSVAYHIIVRTNGNQMSFLPDEEKAKHRCHVSGVVLQYNREIIYDK